MPSSVSMVHKFNAPGDALFGVDRLTLEVPSQSFLRDVQVVASTQNGASASLQAPPAEQVLGRQDVLVAWALAPVPGSKVEYHLTWNEVPIAQGPGRAFLFEHIGFGGAVREIHNGHANLDQLQFNDKASSLVIASGRWVFYRDINFQQPFGAGPLLTVLGPGLYRWLPAVGIPNDELSSLRAVPWP